MILFNGKKVEMEDLAVDVEVKFNDLTAKAQKALFDQDKDSLITEVFASRWVEVREYAKSHIGEFSVAAMNKYIRECMDQNFDSHGIVAAFINILGNRIDSSLYYKLIRSNSYRIKLALAKSFHTPNDILNIIMQQELKNDLLFGNNEIVETIKCNSNYQVADSTTMYTDTFRDILQEHAKERIQPTDGSYMRFLFEHISSGAIIE